MAKSKRQTRVVGGGVTFPAGNLAHGSPVAVLKFDARSNSVSITYRSYKGELDPGVLRTSDLTRDVLEHRRRFVLVGDDDGHLSVIEQIAEAGPPAAMLRRKVR